MYTIWFSPTASVGLHCHLPSALFPSREPCTCFPVEWVIGHTPLVRIH